MMHGLKPVQRPISIRMVTRQKLIACWLLAFFALCTFGCWQHTHTTDINPSNLASDVRQEFLHAWNGYKQYAWGHDELKPLTKGFHDWYAVPLYMTAIDALDSLYLMNFREEAENTKAYLLKNLRFDHDIEVKNFEITIRILGGLLSSYQISGDPRLLHLAKDLGDRLLPVFNSPTGMPYMYINLKTGAVREAVSNPAEIGTLLIEFGTLSKLTGNSIYYEKAKRALVALYDHRSTIGLVGSTINVETGEWIDKTSHISGGIDSYYEYLLKASRLFDDSDCERMWRASVHALNAYLADETRNGLWYRYVDMNTGKLIATKSGALDAFFPAVLALSGDISRARRLQESSFRMWTTFGIEPEEIDYSTMTITYDGYELRPEIIESAYDLHFFTRDSRYLTMGKRFLDDLRAYCRTDTGYAALSSVKTKEKKDIMESFFLAETLKYLYLIFAPRETLDLTKITFNTEAHPIRKTW
jgi:mannosidase alpha-like ER degradation enhancer 2